jgi:hypothetical protein
MTSPARLRRRRQRGMAVRQALRLCEALSQGTGSAPFGLGGQPRVTAVSTRAALRAAGVPPHLAATLRRRLRLIADQEAER